MSEAGALKAALELLRLPSQVRVARNRPLPAQTVILLRIAARDHEAEHDAARLTGQHSDACRQAAIFFIEQVLLGPGSNSLRILGFNGPAPLHQLRRHMALLLKWLHPDTASDEPRSTMARRVIEAWNELKAHAREREEPLRLTTEDSPQASNSSIAPSIWKTDASRRGRTNSQPLARGWRLRRLLQSCLRRSGRRAHFMMPD